MHLLPGHPDPPGQPLVLREKVENRVVGGRDIGRVAGQRSPPERALALAEQRPDVRRHEAGERERPAVPGQLGLAADRVAVVEHLGARVGEPDHRLDVRGHRLAGPPGEPGRVLGPQRGHVLERHPARQVGQRVVRRGLVGDHVDRGARGQQLGQDVGGVAEQPDRQRPPGVPGGHRPAHRVGRVLGPLVQVAVLDPAVDPGRVAVDADRHAAVHRHRERLGTAHPAQPGGQRDRAGQAAAEPLGRDRGERLVGALQDALGADVDPRAGRHLAEHGQPERLEAPELLPGGPLRDQQRVGDQHPRRPLVRAHDADRLARLDQQGLVAAQVAQRRNDPVERVPAARRPAGPAVHDELVRVLGDLGVQVVHQHPQRGLLRPPFARQGSAAGGTDRARASGGAWVGHGRILIPSAGRRRPAVT